ncbi:hypothetical protein SMMN14_02359 [Sphaerulina musiva]
MDFKLLLALVLLICLAKGQTAYDDFDDEIDVNNATASTTTETDGEINVHIINVESDAFYPNSINANPDDRVTFVFHSGNHSVIQSLYGWPCIPQAAIVGQKGFHSGFFPITNEEMPHPTWNLTIDNNTDPIFFYCGAPGSCINKGMLGAINANADTNLTKQIELAKESRYMLEYDETMSPAESASISALAASVLASPKKASSGLTAGSIAGIAIGVGAALMLIGILLFCLRRNKSLEQRLKAHSTTSTTQPAPRMQQNHDAYFPHDDARRTSRKSSPLPTYAQFVSSSDQPKSPESEIRTRSQNHYISYTPYRPHYGHESSARFLEASELGGDVPGQRHELNAETISREADGLGIGTAR